MLSFCINLILVVVLDETLWCQVKNFFWLPLLPFYFEMALRMGNEDNTSMNRTKVLSSRLAGWLVSVIQLILFEKTGQARKGTIWLSVKLTNNKLNDLFYRSSAIN